jgi:hypothetical protein
MERLVTPDPIDPMDPIRQVTRDQIRDVWQALRAGKAEALSAEDQLLGKILEDHADDYGLDFSAADVVAPADQPPESVVNPFLHVSVHLAVERQLAAADPREAVQFYNAMRAQQAGHHDTIHLIGTVFSALLFDVLQLRRPFDTERYRALLRQCAPMAPEAVPAAVDAAFDNEDEAG